MQARGLIPPKLIADGRTHRCNVAGKRGKSGCGDGAYLLRTDGIPAGGFENWTDGAGWKNWTFISGRELTEAERLEANRRMPTEVLPSGYFGTDSKVFKYPNSDGTTTSAVSTDKKSGGPDTSKNDGLSYSRSEKDTWILRGGGETSRVVEMPSDVYGRGSAAYENVGAGADPTAYIEGAG
jgi:hypothetical protein